MTESSHVLVIDDETGSRESMAIAIEHAGYSVKTFDGARSVLDDLGGAQVGAAQLAVCDLRMPRSAAICERAAVPGAAVYRVLRSRNYTPADSLKPGISGGDRNCGSTSHRRAQISNTMSG